MTNRLPGRFLIILREPLPLLRFISYPIIFSGLVPQIGNGQPDWEAIKASASVVVTPSDEYGIPYRLGISSLAWEDGLYLSRDGLRLYAFYAPADMIQYSIFFQHNPICPDITPFLRGPTLMMDLTTNPWGCPNVLHSDIAMATRSNISEPFNPWTLSNLAAPYRYDGGFQMLENGNGTFDVIFNQSTDGRFDDIYWARGVGPNPTLDSFQPMPSPINSASQENNGHLERLSDNVLVLLFDNDGVGDPTTDIRYTLSTNDGGTWSQPQLLGPEINSGTNNLQGHLFFDGKDWWLYFASDSNGLLSIFRSRHRDSPHITTDFNNWGMPEPVIAPGTVGGGLGYIAAVGEPSLTRYGDICFAVVYAAAVGDTDTDRTDIDPWFLPHKREHLSMIRLWGYYK